MSYMSEIHAFISERINGGQTFESIIADLMNEYNLSFTDAENMVYDVEYELHSDGSDAMDGDHQSALASVGWGTDEDYGYYGDDY